MSTRNLSIVVALLMVLAGCGDSSGQEGASAPANTAEDATTDETPEDEGEAEEDLYLCGDVSLPLDQLLALDAAPDGDAPALAAIGKNLDLGDADEWAKFASSLLINREPLGTRPPGLLLASEGAGVDACVAVLGGQDRPVAWQIASVTPADDQAGAVLIAEIEKCVAAAEVVADVKLIDGDAVIALSLPSTTTATTDSCLVDGSNPLEIELPDAFDGVVLSAQTWPFVAPDPRAWVTVNDTALVAGLAPGGLDKATCLAISGLDSVAVQWWNVPGGTELAIIADGEPLSSAGLADGPRSIDEQLEAALASRLGTETETEAAVDETDDEAESVETAGPPDGVFSLFGAPPEPGSFYELELITPGLTETIPCGSAGTLAELPALTCTINLVGGAPQLSVGNNDPTRPLNPIVRRDGEVIEVEVFDSRTVLDSTAQPGATHRYELEFQDDRSDRQSTTATCGSITIPEPGDDLAQLAAGEELFNRSALGAHAYLTLVTDGEEEELYMRPGPDGGRSFDPPLADTDLIDPFTLHEQLANAIESGAAVSFTLDPATGTPTTWTVDGTERELRCLELDTAPPSLRSGGCNPDLDLLGR